MAWEDVKPDELGGLILPGGHAPGMRQYLGSELLRHKVAEYWALGRPVGAICHGVLVLARTSRSDHRAQSLVRETDDLPPEVHGAIGVPHHGMAAGALLPHLPGVRRRRGAGCAARPVRLRARPARCSPGAGPTTDDGPAFVVEDGNYVSARWPGDAYLFAKRFADKLDRSDEERACR